MLSAAQVAQQAGIPTRRRGGKEWACCPLHREKTPSLCFYPDGRWYCFGCHQHGGGADLYAALYGVELKTALRAVGKELPNRPRAPSPGERLRQLVEAWARDYWDDLCRELHTLRAFLMTRENMEDDSLWNAVKRIEEIELQLDELPEMNPAELTKLWREHHE